MAMIKCPECGKDVSDKAKSCPNCGYPIDGNVLNNSNDFLQTEDCAAFENKSPELPMSESKKSTKSIKLHQKTWFAFLMLVVFFPVGCFLIWKHKKATTPIRVISSVVCGLPFLFWVFVFVVLLMPCDHMWAAANCTNPMVCEICGETEGNALGHTWIAASYEAPKTCSVCGETDGEKLKRKAAYSSASAISVIKECLKFIPNCNLSIEKVTSNSGTTSYVLKHNGEMVGIVGLDIDDFDVMALTDPDKTNASLYHKQISIALLMSSDGDMTYEEAEGYFEEAQDRGTTWVSGYASFVSEGMASGMYAFGISY